MATLPLWQHATYLLPNVRVEQRAAVIWMQALYPSRVCSNVLLYDPHVIPAACGRTEHQPSRDICCHVSTENETRPHHRRCQ